jgi:glycosyltransferase involved in cell wall biosynthesis
MTDVLRVAWDSTFPNRNPGGSGVYARQLLRELQTRDDVAITEVGARGGTGFAGTMRWLAAGAGPAVARSQVVHCPAFIAPWRLGPPLVLTIHDTTTRRLLNDQPLEWRAYARLFLPERARSAARVVTGTENSRRDIARDFGVREDRIAVTPYGISERFANVKRATEDVHDPAVLLFPGAPSMRKNLELVLNAMANAPEGSRMRVAHLVITGATAEEFPHYAHLVERSGLKPRVEWRGRVPIDEMPSVMAEADLVAYPSLYEGFGFPPLEAMLAGTPVVASNASCLPEVLGDGAILVSPNDTKAFVEATEAVLTDKDLRCHLVARGKARAAQFTWKRCADLTVEVYREVAGVRGTPRVR